MGFMNLCVSQVDLLCLLLSSLPSADVHSPRLLRNLHSALSQVPPSSEPYHLLDFQVRAAGSLLRNLRLATASHVRLAQWCPTPSLARVSSARQGAHIVPSREVHLPWFWRPAGSAAAWLCNLGKSSYLSLHLCSCLSDEDTYYTHIKLS